MSRNTNNNYPPRPPQDIFAYDPLNPPPPPPPPPPPFMHDNPYDYFFQIDEDDDDIEEWPFGNPISSQTDNFLASQVITRTGASDSRPPSERTMVQPLGSAGDIMSRSTNNNPPAAQINPCPPLHIFAYNPPPPPPPFMYNGAFDYFSQINHDDMGERPSGHPISPQPDNFQATQVITRTSASDSRRPPERIMPRPLGSAGQSHTSAPTLQADSRLTHNEQKRALQKLKKEIYNPFKRLSQRVNLYVKDNVVQENEMEKYEDDKSCAICLEDFEPKQEVILTPCNHMFHEECIVPWVKSNGPCPVCRFAICE